MSTEVFALHGNVDVDVRDAETKLERLEKQARQTYDTLSKIAGSGRQKRAQGEDALMRDLQRIEKQGQNARVELGRRTEREMSRIRRATAVADVRESGRLAKTEAQERGKIERTRIQESSRLTRASLQADTRERINATKQATAQTNRLELEAIRQRDRLARDAARNRVQAEVRAQKQLLDEEKRVNRERMQMLGRLDKAARAAAREREREAKTQIRDAEKAAKALDGKRKTRATARSSLANDVGDGASVAGAGILAALGASTKKAVEFDKELRNINSIAQLSEKNLQKVGDSLIKLSSDPQIRQGPIDLAKALYDVYSTGFEGQKALDIVKAAARGAAAGLTDTATSAGVLMSVLQSGIKGVKTPAEALDVLFQTVNDGRVTFEQLAGSLGSVLPTAAKAGISIQEIGAYLTVATKQGQGASEATNDLLNLIMKLVNPSKEAAEQFDKLGIKYGYAALQGKSLDGMLAEIQKKTKGNADQIKKLLPDMQAQRAALTALTNSGKDYTKALESSNKASAKQGATAKAQAKQNEGAAYQAEIFSKNLDTLAIIAGETLLPELNKLLAKTTDLFKAFQALTPETRESYVKWTAYAGVLLLVGGRIVKFIEFAANCRKALMVLRGAQVATNAATAAGGIQWASLGAAGGPLALAAIAVAGFTVAILGARDTSTMSAQAIRDKWGPVGDMWLTLTDKVTNFSNAMSKAANNGLIDKALRAGAMLPGLAGIGFQGINYARDNLSTSNARTQAVDKSAYNRYVADQVAKGKKPKTFNQWNDTGIDGSHADGLDRVPRDGYIAELHKDEAVLTASEAKKWRSQKASLEGQISSLEGRIDARKLARTGTRTKGGDKTMEQWRQQLRDLKRELSAVKRELGETEREIKGAARRAVKSQIDLLTDAAGGWRDYSRRVEDAADKQIAVLQQTRDVSASLVQGLESKLLDAGVMNQKGVAEGFYARVSRLEKLLDSKPLDDIYRNSRSTSKAATDRADRYEKSADALRNSMPTGSGTGSTAFTKEKTSQLGNRVAEAAIDTVARKSGTDIGGKCLFWVQMILQRTLKGAELAAFKKMAFGVGDAKNAGNRLADAGKAKAFSEIGYAGLRPGDVLFDTQGKNGHTGIYAGNGRVAENNGRRGARGAQKMSDVRNFVRGIDYVYRPGGFGADNEPMATATAGGKSSVTTKGTNGISVENAPAVVNIAPDFAKVLAQFNLTSLAPLFAKQAVPGEGNELRRSMLLDLAKLTPALHTEAAKRGMVGDKANGWVKQVRDALYDLANFAEKPVNDKADIAKRTENLRGRGEAYKSVFGDSTALQAQLDLQGRLLSEGKSFEEINDALEEQQKLLDRISILKAANYSDAEAKQLAEQAGAIDRANLARQRNVEWMQEQVATVDDVADALDKLPTLSDQFKEAQERLSSALKDTSDESEGLQEALDEMPTALKKLIDVSQNAGAEANGLRAKYAAFFEMVSKTKAEIVSRNTAAKDRPSKEALEAGKSRLDDLSRDIDYRARQALTFGEENRRRLDLTNEMRRNGMAFDPARIDKLVNRDVWVSRIESLTSGLEGVFRDSFSNIEGGFSGMFNNIAGGFANMLQQMAVEYLASFVMQQLFGGVLGNLGGTPQAASNFVGKGAGPWIGGFVPHAAGIGRIPADNYPALLHKNEAVLNAAEAESWRQQQKAKELAISGSSGRGGESGGNGGKQGDIHLHLHGTTNVNAGNSREMAQELVGQRMPRREAERRLKRGR